MRRRDKRGGRTAKGQRPKTLKRRNAPKVARRRSSLAADQETKVVRLTRELKEAREQQTATGEILASITGSITDAQPVFNAITRNLRRLFGTRLAVVQVLKDGMVHLAAAGNKLEFKKLSKYFPQALDENTGGGRAMMTKQVLQFVPVLNNPAAPPATQQFARDLGFNSVIFAPMIRGGKVIGAISTSRREPKAFDDKQVALIKAFADQAVIAIENVRQLNETKEALEQQTATSEVLKIISSSPGELEPVFNAMLANATRICEATFGHLWLFEGNTVRGVAAHTEQSYADYRRANPVIDLRDHPGVPLERLAKTKQVVHIPDLRTDQSYIAKDGRIVSLVEVAGARTFVVVPLLKASELIGAIGMYRQEVRPFTDKQIELVKDFAAQAVIAIENTRLLSELRESLQQQTATADVLKIISTSPGQLEPVFNATLENAVRVCGAKFGILYLSEGDGFRTVAMHDVPRVFAEKRRREPFFRPAPGGPIGHIVRTRQVAHIADITTVQGYTEGNRQLMDLTELGGARTMVGVPMLKDNKLIGAILIYRQEVMPFSDKQIELLANFASQAVIAVENVRLFNETKEALEQQTATSEVLKVISSSPGELEPVFQAMLANATRICEAKFGVLHRYENGAFHMAAMVNVPPALGEFYRQRGPFQPPAGSPLDRLSQTGGVIYTADEAAEPFPGAPAKLGGARSLVAVQMLKENKLIGAIVIYRQEVRPFTDKQIELVKNFAAQAVIAIENTRLLNELRQRTDDLTESLEQQTATSEVLKVISSSAGELEPVFQTMLANATRICEAAFGSMLLVEGDARFRRVAIHNAPATFAEFHKKTPVIDPRKIPDLKQLIETKRAVHVADAAAANPDNPIAKYAGARSLLVVPMLKDGNLVGAISIYRQEVRPFTDKQIELVENFAAQAVIAIENTRLLNELRESLEQQTATSEVLQVISSSPGELAPVFEAILSNATRICEAKFGTLTQVVDGIPRLMFQLGVPVPLEEYWRRETPRPSPHNAISRVITTGQAVHVTDLQAYQAYIDGDPLAVAGVELGGIRTLLVVPMLKDDKTFGTIGIYRQEVHPFTDKQIELVSNFAAQAAIAIENTRLLNELRQRTDDLSKSLEDLRTTQDRLVQTQKLASLGQLTAGIAHEIKNPLNFVNNFSVVSNELIDELQDTLKGIPCDDKARAEIKELMDTLKGNLDKVVQHGKRADAIVKNMLLHSREGSGEHRVVDINAIVEESLNLAYHGARAENQGFTITLQRSFDPSAGAIDVFPQDIIRALLNLIANGFYAATKRKAEVNGGDYEPTLTAATKNLGDRLEISIRDNGIGIPPDVKQKMFNPFFTTKPAGEGTGLGLSISHDIVVKQHGGTIEVETQLGEFTEIRVTLPRVTALLRERS